MKLLDSQADIKYQNFIIDTENPLLKKRYLFSYRAFSISVCGKYADTPFRESYQIIFYNMASNAQGLTEFVVFV